MANDQKRSAHAWIATGIAASALACGGAAKNHAEKGVGTDVEAATLPSSAPASTAVQLALNVEPAAPVSPFHAVAELPAPARLIAIKGAILVIAEGYPPVKDDQMGIPIGVVENDELTFPDRLFFQTVMSQLVGAAGTWPDQVDLIAIGTDGRTGIANHYVLGSKGWDHKKSTQSFWFAGMATVGSSVLALRVPSMPWPTTRSELTAIRGTDGGRKLTPVDKAACARKVPADDLPNLRPTEVDGLVFGGTGAGTIFSFGPRCTGEAAVETWPAGSTKSIITNLPAGAGDMSDTTQFASGAGDDAWLFADELLHYDGKVWTAIEGGPRLRQGAVGADGALWAIGDDGALFKGGPSGMVAVPIPNGARVDGLAAGSDGTVWISAGGALLRTKKANDGATAIRVAATAPAPEKPSKSAPKPGSPKCKTNVVVLYGFTKVTPDDFDFPLSRKALKGHTEFASTRFVVTKDYGQKFFSALVPTYAEGTKLAQLIEQQVKGSKPQVVCAEPEVLRELKLDLRTGEVVR